MIFVKEISEDDGFVDRLTWWTETVDQRRRSCVGFLLVSPYRLTSPLVLNQGKESKREKAALLIGVSLPLPFPPLLATRCSLGKFGIISKLCNTVV